jgi:hypothetical protein
MVRAVVGLYARHTIAVEFNTLGCILERHVDDTATFALWEEVQ